MKIIIHRGTREIGGSCVEISEGKEKILIDMGLPLPGINEKKPDARKCLPFFEGPFSGLFVSHSHLDHYGLVEFMPKSVPLYMGGATSMLINISSAMAGKKFSVGEFVVIKDRTPVKLGPFTVTPYLMDHSAMDAYAFLVEAGGKRIFYSGDFRGHGRKGGLFQKFLRLPPKQIDALILEGTNIASETTAGSEKEIEDQLLREFRGNDKNITLILTSGQNLDRMVSLYNAARKSGKTLVVDPYTALVLDMMSEYSQAPHPSRKYRGLRVFFANRIFDKLKKLGYEKKVFSFRPFKITKEEIAAQPGRIVMIARQSMTGNFRKEMECLNGGRLIWSMWKGYMKEANNRIFLDFLGSMGVSRPKVIHTSGHADLDTLKSFVKDLDPKVVIPIHTMHPDKYPEIFSKARLLKDGEEYQV